MPAQTSVLHVRADEKLKAKAADTLAEAGLTLSDAVHILLTRVAEEGKLPSGLTADPEAHDVWFRTRVREALDDGHPGVPNERAMSETQALIDRKRRAPA